MLKKGRHSSHAQDLGAYSRKSGKNKTTSKHLSPNLSALCERSVENTATSVAEEAKKSVCEIRSQWENREDTEAFDLHLKCVLSESSS